MASDLEKSTRVKLLVIFGLFIGLIIGLIAYQVRSYVIAKQQRENFEKLRLRERTFIKPTETVKDGADKSDTTTLQDTSSAEN